MHDSDLLGWSLVTGRLVEMGPEITTLNWWTEGFDIRTIVGVRLHVCLGMQCSYLETKELNPLKTSTFPICVTTSVW